MPKKKKSSSAPKGLSAQEIAALNKKGLQDAMTAVPLLKFEDMFSNFGMFSGGITDAFSDLFGGLIDRGEQTTGMGPAPQEPQVDPYEARLQELMTNRGWSRDQAVANQASASKQGGDLNNDGAVTNDEWAQLMKQMQAPQQAPAPQPQPQPQQPVQGMPAGGAPHAGQPGMPPGVNLTPEQLAAIQKFNGYGRGVV